MTGRITAALFPGQGAQHAGMFDELPARAEPLIHAAREALGFDPMTLDEQHGLAGTRNSQLATFLVSVAWAYEAERRGFVPDYYAGHSVGLWSAAAAAGAIRFADATRLVLLRGTAMAEASPIGAGMIAVLGLSLGDVEEIAAQVRSEGDSVWRSNVNSSTQVTMSGTDAGLNRARVLAGLRGARRIVRLDVSVAAHSPLMAPAACRMRAALHPVSISRPRRPLIGNINGAAIRSPEDLRAELAAAIDHPVEWSTAMGVLAERGVTGWLQLPPGHELARLVPTDKPSQRVAAIEQTGLSEALTRLDTSALPS